MELGMHYMSQRQGASGGPGGISCEKSVRNLRNKTERVIDGGKLIAIPFFL